MADTNLADFSSATGLHDRLGFEVVELQEGFARIAAEIAPHHHNRAGIIHGGMLLAILDEAGGSAGIMTAEPGVIRPSVTVTLTGQFTGQASRGRIEAAATIVSKGNTIFHIRSEVRDESGTLLAFGSSAHRWQSQTIRISGGGAV